MALVAGIIDPYGYEAARGLRRGGGTAQLLARGRAPGVVAARGQPADRGARKTARAQVARPVRAARRADRGRSTALPPRTAAASARGAAAGRHGRRGRRDRGDDRDRVVDGPGRERRAAAPLRLPPRE